MSDMSALLAKYTASPEDPELNFDLGVEYEGLGHTASASSFYLRAAERTEDVALAYNALLRCGLCYEAQGRRNFTALHLYRQAVCLLPFRPEAHYLLAKIQDRTKSRYDCYVSAVTSLSCQEPETPLRHLPEYLGRYPMLFLKATTGVHWEKAEESKIIYREMIASDDCDEDLRNKARASLILLEKSGVAPAISL